jgi:hypothetical protein
VSAAAEEIPERVDRRMFGQLVGIDERTVTRWVQDKVFTPARELRDGRWIQVFSRNDVRVGRAIRSLQKQRPGELTLSQVAAIVRGQLEPPELGQNPAAPHRAG